MSSSSNEPYLLCLQVKGPQLNSQLPLRQQICNQFDLDLRPGFFEYGLSHFPYTVDSPMSKACFFFGSQLGLSKILTDFGLHSFLTQLEKSGMQIRRSSAENIHFLLQVKIRNNQIK